MAASLGGGDGVGERARTVMGLSAKVRREKREKKKINPCFTEFLGGCDCTYCEREQVGF